MRNSELGFRRAARRSRDPDAARGWLSQMHVRCRARSVIVSSYSRFFTSTRVSGRSSKFSRNSRNCAIFFVDANDFALFVGAQVRQQHRSLLPQGSNAAAYRNAVRTAFLVGKSLEQQLFDFGRNRVLESLGFIVRFRPRQTDHVGEQHLRKLVTQRQALGDLPAFFAEIDAPVALDFHEAVARHALERSRHRGRRDVQFFGQARADRRLIFLKHFPDRLEVIFLGYAGFFASQKFSGSRRSLFCGESSIYTSSRKGVKSIGRQTSR